jgi:hypothetical protein
VGFDTDIKPLFRASDRAEMRWALDLWVYEDVKANCEDILARIACGEMPCDEPWSPAMVSKLRAWIAAGMPK